MAKQKIYIPPLQLISQEETYEHFFAVWRLEQLSLDFDTFTSCIKFQR